MILVHAVVPREAVGALGAPGLRGHDAGPVTVLYEETAEGPSRDRDAVVEHGRRVVALAEKMPVLPVRYGTTLPDVAALRGVVEERADAWSRRLAQLAGRCELVVHVEPTALDDRPAPASGRVYLERRIAEIRRHERALDGARTVLAPWSEEQRLLPEGRRLAVLVARAAAEEARAAVMAWAESQDDLDVVVTGPWPPFSFCEETELS